MSILYVLIVVVLIVYSISGLMIQKPLSESMSLVLVMSTFLVLNDDLLILNSGFFSSFSSTILVDFLTFFGKFVICFFSSIYFLIIADFLKKQKLTSLEYLLMILFAILGLLIMCSANDLLTTYLSLELSSLSFYILASFKKTSSYSIESGLKYFITGATSSAFFLLGCTILYGNTGSINFSDFLFIFECSYLNFFFSTSYHDPVYCQSNIYILNNDFAQFGFTLIAFSLFIKLALAPFHLWSIDVYEGSPTNSTFFFATVTKISLFVLLIRFCYNGFFSFLWQSFFTTIGFFSIFLGSFGGLKQRKLKTLLAYSSISHMGYMLISFSSSAFLSIQFILFYMFIYMLSGVCFWYSILLLQLKRNKREKKYSKEMADLIILKKSNKAMAFSLSIVMFSIAGIPPLIGFVSKLNIFFSILGISSYLIGLGSLICSAISTYYYIRIVKIVYFENVLVGKLYNPIKTLKSIIFSIFILSFFFLFFDPAILYLITYKIIIFRHGIKELMN